MKHLIFIISLIFGLSTQAQPFQGRVEFNIEYTRIPSNLEEYIEKLPSVELVSIGAQQVRIDGSTAFGATWVNVRQADRSSGFQLWNIADRQLHVTKSKHELATELSQLPAPLFRPTGESKVILGYLCQKATYTLPGSDEVLTVYYTSRIPSWAFDQLPGLSGFPLYYEYIRGGMKFVVKASTIEQGNIAAAEFAVPAGYETVSQEEFQQTLINLDY